MELIYIKKKTISFVSILLQMMFGLDLVQTGNIFSKGIFWTKTPFLMVS